MRGVGVADSRLWTQQQRPSHPPGVLPGLPLCASFRDDCEFVGESLSQQIVDLFQQEQVILGELATGVLQ